MNALLNKIADRDTSIDPISNGFLSVRSEEKMADSKATFIGVIDDLIASYDSITGTKSIYPGVISDNVKKIAVLRDAAVELKNAIKDGKEFYIPIDIVKNEPAAWPLASGAGVFTLDCGKLFTAGQFAIDKLIELDSKNKPVFYANGQKITSSDKFVKLLEETETEIQLSINILAAKSLYEVINIPGIPSQIQPVKFSGDMYMIGIFLYNYYYGGFEKAIDEMRGEDGSIAFFQNY